MKGRFDVEILNVYLTRIGMARIEKGAIVRVCNKNGKYIFIFKPCTFYQVQGDLTRAAYKSAANFTLGF